MGHGPSLKGLRLGLLIDAHERVCRLKQGFRRREENPEDYGRKMNFICSSLKTWNGYWKVKYDEYWGYVMYPGPEKKLKEIREHYGSTRIRIELRDVQNWLKAYESMADIADPPRPMSREGDEPWFSTGMGAIVIACAGYRPERLVLAGFDNVLSGERDGFKSVLRDSTHKYPPHAWNVEKEMVPLIADYYGVEIVHLQQPE